MESENRTWLTCTHRADASVPYIEVWIGDADGHPEWNKSLCGGWVWVGTIAYRHDALSRWITPFIPIKHGECREVESISFKFKGKP